MPKKATQKNTEEKQDTRKTKKNVTVDDSSAEVASESKAETKAKTRSKKSSKKGTEKSSEEAPASTEPAPRRVPTRESVEQEFTDLVASVEEEINKLRNSPTKSKGVKFLRTLNKRLKTLRNHALRVSKQRQRVVRNNTNSGFLKPVQISKDLAKFTGWDHSQLRSRVDVTKFICEYIKNNNLQDPEDKRRIRVDNDPNLKKLLKFDGKDGKPLTYYSLQTYLKSHFSASPAAEGAAATTQAPKGTPAPKETPARKGK